MGGSGSGARRRWLTVRLLAACLAPGSGAGSNASEDFSCSRPLPNLTVDCRGGTYRYRLPVPGTTGLASSDAGPFLSVSGASSLGVDGTYVHSTDPTCVTYQHYVQGRHRLLWEPGPQVVYGHRWLLFGGPQGATREAPHYYKNTSDGMLGWRGTQTLGAWSAGAAAAPAPVVVGSQPEEALLVEGAGDTGVNGAYVRDLGAQYPREYKVYVKGSYTLMWEPGPHVTRGHRWVLFSDPDDFVSQERPYYYRLSSDGDYGYVGTWTVDQGIYPPPQVAQVQTVACPRCPPGSYSEANWQECLRCPPGRYSLGGADACTACESGTFASSATMTETVRKLPVCGKPFVAAGRGSCTVVVPGATSCQTCPAGRFSALAAGDCDLCQPGTYSEAGADGCTSCPAGAWSGLAAPACQLCPAGRFGNNESGGQHPDSCALCPLGRYGAGTGQTDCADCSIGSYAQTYGLTACHVCATGSHSAAVGASVCDLVR